MKATIVQADRLDFLRQLPPDSVDLVFGSPPYEAARTYGIDFKLKGQAWVDWMVETYQAAAAACRGLVAFVLEGQTRKYRWTATPALLMADLHRAGLCLRKPPIYHRVGIPGSGGPDWLRNDYEFIVCVTRPGQLPWSDNTAMGHPPKWAPGGAMSHRLSDGARVNQWGRVGSVSTNSRGETPTTTRGTHRPSHKMTSKREQKAVGHATSGHKDGDTPNGKGYDPPALANPGNVIKCKVGGGLLGDKLAHENEAPFPEKLAEFFIRSFCPPGGLVVDCFSGSGTTAAVALRCGRNFTGCDLRESQVELSRRRVANVTPELL